MKAFLIGICAYFFLLIVLMSLAVAITSKPKIPASMIRQNIDTLKSPEQHCIQTL